jgi:hypothetical protein
MKHSNLYLGLVLPSGGWQSLIGIVKGASLRYAQSTLANIRLASKNLAGAKTLGYFVAASETKKKKFFNIDSRGLTLFMNIIFEWAP